MFQNSSLFNNAEIKNTFYFVCFSSQIDRQFLTGLAGIIISTFKEMNFRTQGIFIYWKPDLLLVELREEDSNARKSACMYGHSTVPETKEELSNVYQDLYNVRLMDQCTSTLYRSPCFMQWF